MRIAWYRWPAALGLPILPLEKITAASYLLPHRYSSDPAEEPVVGPVVLPVAL